MFLQFKRLGFVFLFSVCVFYVDYLFYVHSCRFCFSNLYPPLDLVDLSQGEEGELDPVIFTQKYRYLAEGRQCFALESEDGLYVMKFFKKNHFNKKKWAKNKGFFRHFRFNEHDKSKLWRTQLIQTARCFHTAIGSLHQESGLMYSHFHKTSFFKEPLKVRALFGYQEIDLNETSFVVQRKAEMVVDRLSKCLSRNDTKAAVDSLRELRKLLISRALKGFTDDKQYYQVNYGFIDSRAVQLDVGKLYSFSPSEKNLRLEVDRLTNNLKKWVKKNYRPLYEEFELSLASENDLCESF